MPGGIRKNTRRLTFCAICCALGVVIMTVGSLFETLDLSSAAIAALLIVLVVLEIGGFWPWMVYAATGLLALLLPLKGAAVFYLGFLGYYPIIKEKIEARFKKALGWVLKLAIFILALTAGILLAGRLLFTGEVKFIWYVGSYFFGGFAFVLFDILLTRLLSAYLFVWRKRLKIDRLNLK